MAAYRGRSTRTLDDMLAEQTQRPDGHPEKTFGLVFEATLLLPLLVGAVCFVFLWPGVLPRRSPLVADFGFGLLSSCALELFLVPIAIVRLGRRPTLRTIRSWLLTAMAAVLAASFVAIYLFVVAD